MIGTLFVIICTLQLIKMHHCCLFSLLYVSFYALSALTLLVGRQEEH